MHGIGREARGLVLLLLYLPHGIGAA
jgi:hypothetical protein